MALLLPLAAACSHARTSPTPAPATASPPTTPGRLSVTAPGIDLAITDAVAHLGGAGNGDLTMTIRNNSDVPEHLAMVATPDGGRGTLQSDATANGSLSTAGILLMPHTTVAFGGHGGPRVVLPKVQLAGGQRVVTLTMQFGVAGLVHLVARVAGS
jgi:copper(I)-binding protein